MLKVSLGIAAVFAVAALVGLSFAPAVSATRYDIDITKTVKGYVIHVFGWIDVDRQAKTVTGHIEVTITDPSGAVIFDKVYDFTYTWTSAPSPITLFLPGVGTFSISVSSLGSVAVTATAAPTPEQRSAWHNRLYRVQ